MNDDDFQHTLMTMGQRYYRTMPWRIDTRPYYVLVSELMLQQTQVVRVIPKFEQFIERFPDVAALARAELSDVIILWQGLGYNRRAKFLHDAAKQIMKVHDGVFPNDRKDILRLPGVGVNTCGAIEAYAFNRPATFIETNVRTVYIHHFFGDDIVVDDKQILERLEYTIDKEHPREFYWALMDYGSWLKASGVRNLSQSRHYKKQPALEGSIRQVRGRIVRALAAGEHTKTDLMQAVSSDDRFDTALQGLVTDGIVSNSGDSFHLTK